MSAPSFESRRALQNCPKQSPVMFQTWQRLLFLHWECNPEEIEKLLPAGLHVDTYNGKAWIGVVPFLMRKIRPTWSPVVPYISNFLELNVRTYVHDDNGNPGVWFFSLDANRLLAVQAARTFFHLPYYWAKMSVQTAGTQTIYRSQRFFGEKNEGINQFEYSHPGQAQPADDETLEFFLVERYLLFSPLPNGQLAIGRVHHKPYEIQPVELQKCQHDLFSRNGIPHTNRPPDHELYSPGVDVSVYALQR